ncbi:MAG TPA: CBS domain-containing protein [Patescibacteria group bacterium]|nr:CBS domain-containing protein [Patescibacteria group bacterium]
MPRIHMLVGDVMSKKVDHVTRSTSVKEVCQIIFGRGINGVPVVDGRKVVGFITEKDVISKLFPSIQEYMEDPINTSDFEKMEEKASEILKFRAEKIMAKNPITITSDTPLLRAQSTMSSNKIGRLPVVDEEGNLIGILSKGDIFRSVVGSKIPFEEEEGFYDWQSKDLDKFVNWNKRLSNEIPDLTKEFKKRKVKKVIDVGFSTGEHAIALAKNGFEVVGVDTSSGMHKIAENKKEKQSSAVKDKIKFLTGKYEDLISELPGGFDAAIFLGNALPHVIYTDDQILKRVSKLLKPKNSIMVFQIINMEKVFKVNGGFREFVMYDYESKDPYSERHIIFGFYDRGRNKILTTNRAVLNNELGRWVFRGINSTPIVQIGKDDITKMLKKLGFSKISFYGGMFFGPLLKDKFDPLKSDWLNVVAIR